MIFQQIIHPLFATWQRLQRLPGFVACSLAIVVIWLGSIFSVFDSWDRLYYDNVVKNLHAATSQRETLLVEVEPGTTHEWSNLLAKLVAAGARQVVFVLPLSEADLRAIVASGHANKAIIGQALAERRDRPGTQTSVPLPQDLTDKLKSGVVALPADESGSPRSQHASYRVGSRDLQTVETVAAINAGIPIPAPTYLINFHRGHELPNIRAERLEREQVLPQLVSGKTVLVGYSRSPYLAQLSAPGLARDQHLSQLEFHGLAVDTLLQNKAVGRAEPIARGLHLLLFGFLLILIYQPLRLATGFWVTLILMVGMSGIAWVSLRFFDYWPETSALSLIAPVVFALVFRAKASGEDLHLRRLLSETSGKLQKRILPVGFLESGEHWSHVINLVDQMLQLNRTIFLERVPQDHRVQEVQALRCSIDDIAELRRDYRRFPYTTAIEQRRAIEVSTEERTYLKIVDPQERQFLTPLIFGGEVLGFWAFSLNSERVGDIHRFRSIVDDLAEQIGFLLYQRKLWQERRLPENGGWRRYLADDTLTLYRKLSQAIVALERRVSGYEQMFSGLTTASVVYDLFGRVMLINERMTSLLVGAGLTPSEMTAVDLIAALTGREMDTVRHNIQELLVDSKASMYSAKLPGEHEQSFILYVRPLEQRADEGHEATPFRTHGLLLELIDTAQIKRLFGSKAELVRYLSLRLNNNLAAILGAAQLFQGKEAVETELRSIIESETTHACATLDHVQKLLAQEPIIDPNGCYPLDPRNTVDHAIGQCRTVAAERQIDFVTQMPATPFLVHANPRELDNAFVAVLTLLTNDAVEGSRIGVYVKMLGETAEFRFANVGFGIPDERLEAIFARSSETGDAIFQSLRVAVRHVEGMSGTVQVKTGLGEGYVVCISLKAF
ncbi:MAG: CHASE2 domain-containing protein [Pseudomonadota bacterium]